ncbi:MULTISPECIES: potassium channel family protein [Mesorhizobium]
MVSRKQTPAFRMHLVFFVTFTSLGYGDYVPEGLGRFFAIFDVVSGLALTALLIGKFASERQSAILVLLHTSDCQQRISGFAQELEQLGHAIADLTRRPIRNRSGRRCGTWPSSWRL